MTNSSIQPTVIQASTARTPVGRVVEHPMAVLADDLLCQILGRVDLLDLENGAKKVCKKWRRLCREVAPRVWQEAIDKAANQQGVERLSLLPRRTVQEVNLLPAGQPSCFPRGNDFALVPSEAGVPSFNMTFRYPAGGESLQSLVPWSADHLNFRTSRDHKTFVFFSDNPEQLPILLRRSESGCSVSHLLGASVGLPPSLSPGGIYVAWPTSHSDGLCIKVSKLPPGDVGFVMFSTRALMLWNIPEGFAEPGERFDISWPLGERLVCLRSPSRCAVWEVRGGRAVWAQGCGNQLAPLSVTRL